MKKVLAEITSKLRENGAESYFLTGITCDGVNFYAGKGDIGLLIGIAMERIFETDPERAMVLFKKILSDISGWDASDSKQERTLH